MKIGQPFNKLKLKEYVFYIDNHKKYTDFNTLGLYRSIIENTKLNLEEKIEVREYAHKVFKKSFDFLQLKDPQTFFEVSTLGEELTDTDERQIWKNIITNQQKILADKKIKHRHFGDYSTHNCGNEDCPMNGLMIRQGSFFAEGHMQFDSDKNDYAAKSKSQQRKKDRKNSQQIIKKEIDNE
jgi:hypothetical protein